MLPGAVAVATVLLFLTAPGEHATHAHWSSVLNRTAPRVCIFGLLIALLFCVLLAVIVCRRYTRADSACPGPFDQLRQGFETLEERLAAVCPDPSADDAPAACREASKHSRHLGEVFREPSQAGLQWLLGTGYVDAWRRLHALDEAVLHLAPVPLVLQDALRDELRLEGSNIPQGSALLKRLRLAISSLSPTAGRYLIEAPPHQPSRESTPDEDEPRAVLAQVRSTINEYRDSRREGLVRARNRLYAIVIFAGLTGCVLLFVAILSGAPKRSIAAVSAFYLVGGVIGLVRLMQSALSADGASQDDYGLGVVRLIQTPLFSGLAAVGGVVLVRLAQGQGTTGGEAFELATTFDLAKNPYGLVAAGFFGLTPALLLSGLQHRIDQYRTDLSKSSNGESQTPGAA